MKVKSLFFIGLLISSIFSIIPFEDVYAVHVPPTKAIERMITSNSTVNSKNYSSPINLKSIGKIVITGSDHSNTIYFNVTAANGTNGRNGTNGTNGINGTTITPLTCGTNFQVHGITVSGTVGTIHCAVNNSTGSTSTYDTIQNIGKGGSGFYSGNNTKTNFQFRNLTSIRPDLFTLTHNATDVNLNSTFKAFTTTCGGTQYIQTFDNTTGKFTCVTNPGLTSVTGQNNGNGIQVYTGNSGTHILLFNTLRSDYGLKWTTNATDDIIHLTFKNDNATCSNGYFMSAFNNSTGVYTCTISGGGTITTANNIGTGGFGLFKNVTSNTINLRNITTTRSDLFSLSQSSNNLNFASLFKSDTLSCLAGNAITSFNNVTGSYTCSPFGSGSGTITTANNIGHGGKGFFKDVTGSTINLRNVTSTRTDLITISQNLTDVNLGSSFKAATKTCAGGSAMVSFDNTTGLYACSSFGSGTITGGNNLGSVGTGLFNSVISGVMQFIKISNGPTHNVKITSNSTTLFVDANNTAQLGCSDNGECLVGTHPNATKNNINTLRNATNYMNFNHNSTSLTPAFLFRINSKTCGANSFVTTLSNSSDSTCATPTSSGITQINGQSGPTVNIQHHSNSTSITNTTNTINLQLKPNVVLTNGSKQIFTKSLDFGSSILDYFGLNSLVIRDQNDGFATTLNGSLSSSGNGTIALPKVSSNHNYNTILSNQSALYDMKGNYYSLNGVTLLQIPTGGIPFWGGSFWKSTQGCTNGQGIKYSTGTSSWSCGTFTTQQLNNVNQANQTIVPKNFNGTLNKSNPLYIGSNITITSTDKGTYGQTIIGLGQYVPILNGSQQTFTKPLTINQLNDSSVIINHNDNTKKLQFQNAGMSTSVTTTIRNNATTSQGINLPATRETETFAIRPILNSTTPADPTGTTSTTGVMTGMLAGFTPQVTGRIQIIIEGDLSSLLAVDGVKVDLRTGTGASPGNGAVLSGNVCGHAVQITAVNSAANQIPFVMTCQVTGLTINTHIWIEMGEYAISASTASVKNITVNIMEI